MKEKGLLHSIFLVIVLLCGTSCADDVLVNRGTTGSEDVWVTIPFGHVDFEQTTITTRSTLSEVAESRVNDLYLFIFVGGKSVYNNYFGSDSKKSTKDEVENAGYEQCWYVSNRTSESNDTDKSYPGGDNADTHGAIHIRSPKVTGGTLYLVANANAYTVNISPDKLSTVRTEDDLKKLTANLSGDVVTRYGYFPMVGKVENVKVDETTVTVNDNNIQIPLTRLDAKVEVNIVAATGHSYDYGGFKQTVKDFTPESWRVVNVPKGAFLLDDATVYDGITGYFSTSPIGFETAETITYTNDNGEENNTTRHGFSFYMLENRYVSHGDSAITDGDFNKREQRNKNADGTNATSGNVWTYAPDEATYIEIKGFLSMDVEEEGLEIGTQELGANVTYYVHLGDFKKYGLNNYKVERNTHYTYNITVKGVKNIEVEVATNEEKQPGAEGNIFVSQQASMLLDAHYAQYVTSVDVSNLDVNTMAWYVNTPFGKDGSPRLNGIDPEISPAEYADALKEYDYKWIWFMINPDSDYDSDGNPEDYSIPEDGESYSENNQWYPGDDKRNAELGTPRKLMDVEEFVNYMKLQKSNYENGDEHIFRNGKIFFTVFVDEYYYEEHPIEGEDSPVDLWKQFVNQPNRLVHILCGSNVSLDGMSSATNSVITIRQRAIQTPYNTTKSQAGLPTAWGCEVVDETDGHFWFYDTDNESTSNTPSSISAQNTSDENGRYNTACLWGLINTDGTFNDELRWKDYLTFNRGNASENDMTDNYFLRSGKRGMLYVPLTRNRDNDGDGLIDADEVRWYIASLGQLYGLYMGEPGMKGDARLYPLGRAALGTQVYEDGPYAGIGKWRSHVVSSTSVGGHPRKLWAEEGLSVSDYGEYKSYASHSVRCVRNLGMNNVDESSFINVNNVPEPLIKDEKMADGSYRFDLSNINEDAVRSKTEIELEAGNEHSYMGRIYYGFETGESVAVLMRYESLKTMLDAGESPCPEGYRVPNMREGALMAVYCPTTDTEWWEDRGASDGYRGLLVSSYYSLGEMGNPTLYSGVHSWFFSPGLITVGSSWNNTLTHVRCVRDWEPPLEE